MATSSSAADAGFLARPADHPVLERTEDLLRSLAGCASVEAAAALAADHLPGLVGADWVRYSPAQGAADRAHGILAARALADACVYSQGQPPTVAAVPVIVDGTPVGVLLMGRKNGLFTQQLHIAALCAEHTGKAVPALGLARTA